VIKSKEYAFIALNYYSFYEDPLKVIQKEFAPEKDVEFKRAFDVMNYPSVGHFSGFVLNTKLAKEALKESLLKHDINYFEKHRGIIFDIGVRALVPSKLPSYFLGKRVLAARAPDFVDYESLYHMCLDYYEYHLSLFHEGLTTKSDLEYRAHLVLAILPKAIVSNAPYLKNAEIKRITVILEGYFKDYKRFKSICMPLLLAVKYFPVKIIFKFMRFVVRVHRKTVRILKK
jgi:hypothetical protein